MYLNTWFLVDNTVWGTLGSGTLLEEYITGGGA